MSLSRRQALGAAIAAPIAAPIATQAARAAAAGPVLPDRAPEILRLVDQQHDERFLF